MSNKLAAADLVKSDDDLKSKQDLYDKYSKPAEAKVVEATKAALEKATHKCTVVDNKDEALKVLAGLLPKDGSISLAGSTTLTEIGLTTYIKDHPDAVKRNIKADAMAAMGKGDMPGYMELLRQGAAADVFFTSACAVTEKGEILACDLTGTRVGGFNAAKSLVVVVGSNKLVADWEAAEKRMKEYCLAWESARVRVAYAAMGVKASSINNVVGIHGPNPWGAPGRVHVVIVNESLGY